MTGFIKLHRKIVDWEWYGDVNAVRIFLHIMLMANYKPKSWRGISIQRGQYLTSPQKLGDALNLSRQRVRTSLNKLESTNVITIKATNQYTLITVTGYDEHQSNGNGLTNDPTIKQPTDNQRITTTKERKKDKKEKNSKYEGFGNLPIFLNSDTWRDFINHRKDIKSPMTDKAIQLMFKKLGGYHLDGLDTNKMLENSIINGWKSVFPEKSYKGVSSNGKSKQSAVDYVAELERKEAIARGY